jgi:hypothetical protein
MASTPDVMVPIDMAGEGLPSTALATRAEGVDADLRRYDEVAAASGMIRVTCATAT